VRGGDDVGEAARSERKMGGQKETANQSGRRGGGNLLEALDGEGASGDRVVPSIKGNLEGRLWGAEQLRERVKEGGVVEGGGGGGGARC
jgi:hypothetical protein